MCDSIKAAKTEEKKSPETFAVAKKIELLALDTTGLLPPPIGRPFQFSIPSHLSAESRPHCPVAPVPIG
jgi:hypothetical protein